ncbi:hypothetical protein ACFVSN_40550 [Kitasatospora sp. NPDC057904]|uniref:hypothetical protein n=1 Tax=Kitasatospora sp. NPDC057904 TaxID=3346275 RepID=UPI0036DCCBE3
MSRTREHVEDFVRYTADPDPRLRQAVIPALGMFLDDGYRVIALSPVLLSVASGCSP